MSYRIINNETLKLAPTIKSQNNKASFEPVIPSDYTDNSYLLDGRLYFVSATPDRLMIIISDFYNNTVLRSFTVDREDTITFKNTPIIQEGLAGSYFTPGTKELTKTSQLLRKMLAGNAVIAALNDQLGIGLTIGSNKKMIAAPTGGYMPSGGGMVPTMMTGGGSWTKSVRFKMLVDSSRLTHITGEMETSVHERIEEYTHDLKLAAECLYFHDGHYVYGFYDKKKRALLFSRFDK